MVLAAAGWLAWQGLYLRGGDRPVAWVDVTGRTLAAPERRELRAIESASELRAALGFSATTPRIDFSRRRAILIAAGPRSSTAYGLQVLGVTKERARIVVSVRELSPTLARPGLARLAFPFRLITIPRGDEPVALEVKGRP